MKTKATLNPARILLLLVVYVTFFVTLFTGELQAQTTYTTLTPGDWNNTTIWSTDGITPCFCRPSKTIDTFDIEIRNHVVVNQPIQILNGSSLIFDGVSSLTGNAAISNTSGILAIKGNTTLTGISIRNFMLLQIDGALISNGGDVSNFGMVLNHGDLTLNGANLINRESSSMQLLAGSTITLINGDFTNIGGIYMENVCVSINGGNMENLLEPGSNRTGGRIYGSGAFDLSGNVANEATWESNIDWCAQGTDRGMPHPENCNSNACSLLPVDFLSVSAEPFQDFEAGGVLVEWSTFREQHNDFFTIESSTDGEHFSEIFRIDSKGDTESGHSYGYHDSSASKRTQLLPDQTN